MSKIEVNLLDIIAHIYKHKILKFIIATFIMSFLLTPLLFYLQKDLVTDSWKSINVEIVSVDDYVNQDFLLLNKIDKYYQDLIQNSFANNSQNNIFFIKTYDKDTYFYNYYELITERKNLSNHNKLINTDLELIQSSFESQDGVLSKKIKLVFSSFANLDKDLLKISIQKLNATITTKIQDELLTMKNEIEKNNITILNEISQNLEEELESRKKIELRLFAKKSTITDDSNLQLQATHFYRDSSLEYFRVLIKKYLNQLDVNHEKYLGGIIKNSKLKISKIKDIKILDVNSNFSFIILRSIIFSFLLSTVIVFFFFLFKFNFEYLKKQIK